MKGDIISCYLLVQPHAVQCFRHFAKKTKLRPQQLYYRSTIKMHESSPVV